MKTGVYFIEIDEAPLETMNAKTKYYTYVIRSKKDGRFYTGLTLNLRKRFSEHNTGKVMSTKGGGPFDLVYYEFCLSQEDARAREKYLKSGMGKRYLRNRLKRFLSLTGEK